MNNQVSAPTQEQLYHQAHRQVNDTLQQAYWMAGKMPDAQGNVNPNPLSHSEMVRLAESKKPYAWAFQSILDGAANK